MNEESEVKRKPNPRENASFFSTATFLFTLPAFIQGWRRELAQNDIYETISRHKACVIGDKFEKLWKEEVNKCQRTEKKPSLATPLFKMFGFDYVILGIVVIVIEVIIRPWQCILIGHLLSFYSSDEDLNTAKKDIYLYGAGVALCSLLISFLTQPHGLSCLDLGLKIRVACSTLVYRKILKLKLNVFEKTNSGKILTLATSDCGRFFLIPVMSHYIWTGFLQIIVITCLLYEEFGISAIFGVCFMFIIILSYHFLGRVLKILRLKIITRTDDRVRVMKEVISGIQVIKMYTWENYFSNLVSFYRRMEIRSVRLACYIKASFTTFYLFVLRTSVFITILAYVVSGNDINAVKAFKLICFYNAFRNSILLFYPKAIALLTESRVPLKRLNSFLMHDEVEPTPENKTAEDAVCIQNALVKRDGSENNVLIEINMKVKRNNLIAIVGPVGSGKSSLLNIILQELGVTSGKVSSFGSFSYAPQEPWIFNGSVRQNILFSSAFNQERYNEVLNVCCLKHDLQILPYYDLTIIGGQGTSLSGGQKARISLARAVYRGADIYILDDPLSAVDSEVGKAIFDQCIKTFLQEKTVILVTHQLQYLQLVDKIYVLNNSAIEAEGTFSELQSQNFDFDNLLQKNEDEQVIKDDTITATNVNQEQPVVSNTKSVPKVEEEKTKSGIVTANVYKSYFTTGSNVFVILITLLLLVTTQIFASGSDYFIAYWVNLEQTRVLSGNETNTELSIDVCIYIYSSMVLCIIAFALATIISLQSLCMKSSIKLHNDMFRSIINAPLSFFYTNQSGRILNRFSKDMEIIDEELPIIMNDSFVFALSTIGVIVVVVIVNYLNIVPIVICVILLWLCRKFYLKTSRSLKRLDATTRSPIMGYINTTFQGLPTIRAFQAQRILVKEFNDHLNLSSSALYMYLAATKAFGYYLDLICNIFNVSAIFILLATGDTSSGNIGLTISQCLGVLGVLQFMVRQYSEMENCMTSVERVLEYKAIEPECKSDNVTLTSPSNTWPENGAITFECVSLCYISDQSPILKCINFKINPLQKIGIVGRTGSGKSSLINALFRLSEVTGTITVDEININQLPLHHLRSKISSIPQQPTIFCGSVRQNLDPYSKYTDEALWKVLEYVELKSVVHNLQSGLDTEITEGGLNFSVGQRQLMCLARAILKENKILVLDEATANVDLETDALIQKTVKEKFSNCTVLTIAHRLDTVIDSDKILVMEDGIVSEFDHPHLLLQNTNGIFYSMVQHLEKPVKDMLKTVAEKNYNQIKMNKKSD